MANIKLTDDYWETSGVYDITQNKTQRQINSDNVDKIKEEQIYRFFDSNNTIKAARDFTQTIIYGDSIFASGYDYISTNQTRLPLRGGNVLGFAKNLYDALNRNRIIEWRSIEDTAWTINNGTKNVTNITALLQPTLYTKQHAIEAGTNAQISMNKATKVIFCFVGARGNPVDVSITVKKDSGSYVAPSTILKGRISKKGQNDDLVYENAPDTFNTGYEIINGSNVQNNWVSCFKYLVYNGLDPNSVYTFRLAAQADTARICGVCWTAEEQVDFVTVNARPGYNWSELLQAFDSAITVPEATTVILQAPMYHDRSEADAVSGARALLNKMKQNNLNVVLCSCPPGGVCVTGSETTILGDDNASFYTAGENFVKFYTYTRKLYFSTPLPNTNNYPRKGEKYRCTINGTTYDVEFMALDSLYNTDYGFVQVPENFPDTIPSGTTFTKITSVSSASLASFTVSQSVPYNVPMEKHRDLMADIAKEYNIPFIDVFGAFVDVANSVNETIYTDSWDMSTQHPFYDECLPLVGNPNYPTLSLPFQMNYLSNFFNLGDGHHLINNAHSIIWKILEYKLGLNKTSLQETKDELYNYRGSYHRIINNGDTGVSAVVPHDGWLQVSLESTTEGMSAIFWIGDIPVLNTKTTAGASGTYYVKQGLIVKAENNATHVYADVYY